MINGNTENDFFLNKSAYGVPNHTHTHTQTARERGEKESVGKGSEIWRVVYSRAPDQIP